MAPSLVVVNGRVWTADRAKPWVEAIAVRGGVVTAVGTSREIRAMAGPGTEVLDAGGRFVMPGFHDGHVHFASGSMRLTEVDLTGACTPEAMAGRIRGWMKENPKAAWVVGGGWEYTCFDGLPTRQQLDAIVSEKPAFLRAYDGHTSWANTKALEAAGVTRTTEYKGFGELVRDAQGEPAGAFKEGASALISKHVPAVTREQRMKALERGLGLAASLGITSITNASGSRDELGMYAELAAAGKLTLRANFAMSAGRDAGFCRSIVDLREKYSGPLLRVNAVKFLIDGVVESHTAAMLEKYSDGGETMGQLSWTPEELRRAVKACHETGWQPLTHAIGDRGIRLTLDAYEQLPKDARARVEHIEVIHPADIGRFAKLGAIASFMPIHADPDTVVVWAKAVGRERERYSFAWRSLEKAGAKLVFSSDWPASISLDPIRGLHNAVNRQTVDGRPAGGWLPQERVGVETALAAYTRDAAWAEFSERVKGRLAAGLLADFVILSKDPFRIPAKELHTMRVDATVFDGKLVYRRSQ